MVVESEPGSKAEVRVLKERRTCHLNGENTSVYFKKTICKE
jgi:hypothetical protein